MGITELDGRAKESVTAAPARAGPAGDLSLMFIRSRPVKKCSAPAILCLAASIVAAFLIATIVKIPTKQETQSRNRDLSHKSQTPAINFLAKTSLTVPANSFHSCIQSGQSTENVAKDAPWSTTVVKCLHRQLHEYSGKDQVRASARFAPATRFHKCTQVLERACDIDEEPRAATNL